MENSYLIPQLRVGNYIQFTTLALPVYDWLILLDREIEYVWQSEWTIPKVLYIITRYGAFLDASMFAINTAPFGGIDSAACDTLSKVSSWSTFIGIGISESILLLRTIAIYSGSKRVVIPLSILYVAGIVAGTIVGFLYFPTKPVPGLVADPAVDGCYIVQRSVAATFLPDVLLLLLFELVVLVLTIRSAIHAFSSGTPLLRVVYRDSIGFFLVLFAVSLISILIHELVHPVLNGFMVPIVRVMHSIICCRILLNLRRAASLRDPSTNPRTMSLAFATSPGQEMGQTETDHFEMPGARNDEEDLRHQADGEDFVAEHRH